MRRPRKHRARRAFTLIELLAVVVLMALLATAATLSLGRTLRKASLEDAAAAWARFDAGARETARHRAEPAVLRIDPARGAAEAQSGFRLPEGFRFDRVLTRLGTGGGPVELAISPRGFSPSYAVRLTGRGGSTWVVATGLTGETRVTNDDREVEQRFETMRSAGDPAGDDAD